MLSILQTPTENSQAPGRGTFQMSLFKKIHPPEQLGFTENNEPSTARAMLNVSDLNHWFENVDTRFVQESKITQEEDNLDDVFAKKRRPK